MYDNPVRGRLLIENAYCWIAEDVSVVPALPQSKVVNLRWREFETRHPNNREIRFWFTKGINNLAVVCGTGGLLVLDFDDLAKYQAWKEKAGRLAGSYTESTGRGMHVFYQVDQAKTERFTECEALGLGHLCLAAPSIHPSGATYQAVGDPCTPIIQVETSELFSLLSKHETMGDLAKQGEKLSKVNRSIPSAGNNGAGKQDLLTKIKTGFSLVEYVSQFTELKPSGKNGRFLLGRCPLHEDQSPSLWVDRERGIWRCFVADCSGSRGGDVINFYALKNNITAAEAIRLLAREVR